MGKHPIVPAQAGNPNYEVVYVSGTETITPAPLTITPTDVAVGVGAGPHLRLARRRMGER